MICPGPGFVLETFHSTFRIQRPKLWQVGIYGGDAAAELSCQRNSAALHRYRCGQGSQHRKNSRLVHERFMPFFKMMNAWRWIVRNWFLLIDVDIEHLRAVWCHGSPMTVLALRGNFLKDFPSWKRAKRSWKMGDWQRPVTHGFLKTPGVPKQIRIKINRAWWQDRSEEITLVRGLGTHWPRDVSQCLPYSSIFQFGTFAKDFPFSQNGIWYPDC